VSAVARVSRVSEVAEREAPALLAYLQERGLVPGAERSLKSARGRQWVTDKTYGPQRRDLAAVRCAQNALLRLWARLSGRLSFAMTCRSMDQGSASGTQVTYAFSAIQSELPVQPIQA
jgi:hypothetical protein